MFATDANLINVLNHIRATCPTPQQSVACFAEDQLKGVGTMEMDICAIECTEALRNRGLIEKDAEGNWWPTPQLEDASEFH